MKRFALFILPLLLLGAASAHSQDFVVLPASHDTKSDAEAFLLISVKREQIIELHQQNLSFEKKRLEMLKLEGTDQMERGAELNKESIAGLKKALTAGQFKAYCAYWDMEPTFDKAQSELYAVLQLSSIQRKDLGELEKARKQQLNEAKAAWEGSDSEAAATLTLSMRNAYTEGLKKILSKRQLAKYEKTWEKTLAPISQVVR